MLLTLLFFFLCSRDFWISRGFRNSHGSFFLGRGDFREVGSLGQKLGFNGAEEVLK